MVKFTEAGEKDWGGYDPEGRRVDGFVTQAIEENSGTFGSAVHRLAASITRPERSWTRIPGLLMTTEACWSGYSEFAVTSTWSEITLTVPDWNWERSWPSLGDFLRAVADANPEAGE